MNKSADNVTSFPVQANAELARYRGEIDAIDNQIIALLKQRSEVVLQVGDYKRRQAKPGCFARPGREAEIVRRIMQEFSGARFSAEAAAQIWRIIIAASTRIESDLRISVCAMNSESALYWMAREYFGASSDISTQPVANRIVGDVIDGKAEIGILPTFQDETHGNWWLALAAQEDNSPQIFAHIPFVVERLNTLRYNGFAIAQLEPEATGDDITLIAVQTQDISIHKLNSAFSTAGIKTTRVQMVNEPSGLVSHLLAVEDFIHPADPRLERTWQNLHDTATRLKVLGSYARPIEVKKKR